MVQEGLRDDDVARGVMHKRFTHLFLQSSARPHPNICLHTLTGWLEEPYSGPYLHTCLWTEGGDSVGCFLKDQLSRKEMDTLFI